MSAPESEAERLTAALNSLLEGEIAKAALIALGPAAIPALRRFLLEGRPGTVYQPRRWAVEALGALGAREVLMEYLSLPRAPDPQIEFAEEAVRNAAIREFLRWPDAATVSFLLAKRMMLPALVEVFGQLRVLEAIPYLDRASASHSDPRPVRWFSLGRSGHWRRLAPAGSPAIPASSGLRRPQSKPTPQGLPTEGAVPERGLVRLTPPRDRGMLKLERPQGAVAKW